MTSNRWSTIERLCHEALARQVEDRAAFLTAACASDDSLRHEVESLLAHDGQAAFLSIPAAVGPAPAVAIGQRLGPYVISALLGAGGMGEVYRARDSTLGRDVAIKVLPVLFTSDSERLARFEREARVLAALNHPNIATIYGVEESGGVRALVLELVDGETLAEKLSTRALPITTALAFAGQIADALDAAHEKGIIHRDVKPANVKITPDGTVKILDFGLAKLDGSLQGEEASSRGRAFDATRRGTVLGTAAYMSPEQARGQAVDKRTDIWAYGCVLYEMLVGRAAFGRETLTDTLAAVVERQPDWSGVPHDTPPAVRRLLQRCLDKDPKRRLRDIGEARIALEEAISSAALGTPRGDRFARRALIVAGAGALILGAAAAVGVESFGRKGPLAVSDVTRTLVDVTPADVLQSNASDVTFGNGRPSRTSIALPPDGRPVAFSAVQGDRQQLYLRRLDQLEATPIVGSEGGSSPFFSPDGQWLGYWAKGSLWKVALAGGPPSRICAADSLFGASWGKGNTIVYALSSGGLWQVPAGGGTPRPLTTPDPNKSEYSHRLPHVLPDSRAVIFTITQHFLPKWDETRLAVASLQTGEYTDLGPGADGRYVPSGHMVFLRSGTLWAAPFDVARRRLTGNPLAVLSDVMQAANMTTLEADTGGGQFAVSDAGSLIFVRGGIHPDRVSTLANVDRQGHAKTLPPAARPYFAPMVSPDGARLAVWTQGQDRNVWTYDIARNTMTRLTTEGRNSRAIWTPDGTRITYAGSTSAGVDNIFWIAADGSGAPERLTTSPLVQAPSSWSPDGRTLALTQTNGPSQHDIFILSLDGDRQSKPLLHTRFDERYPEFSWDGHWIAYVSDESGRSEVYVQPYPGPGPRRQISSDGGTEPGWSRNGKELFYRVQKGSDLQQMAVTITAGSSFAAATPRLLFKGEYQWQETTRGYDFTPDGQQFYVVQRRESAAPVQPTEMILVQHWFDELKRRVPSSPTP